MFNPSYTPPAEAQYLFDISRYYRMWFSTNPDLFLGIENQLRFIRMRRENPDARLHFIYSSDCLTEHSIEVMQRFCEQYNIITIEFEAIPELLNDERDKALYAFARDEIQRCVNHTGGNMAAASDCVRLLVPLIDKLGVYMDCDKESRLSRLNAPLLQLRGPVLFPAEMLCVTATTGILTPNSDFLAFGRDGRNPSLLAQDALLAIRNLQEGIIKNYTRPFSWETLFPNAGMDEVTQYPEMASVFGAFLEQAPQNPSIFDFRLFVSSLPDMPVRPGTSESVKSFLYRLSVINMAGPGTYTLLLKHLFPKDVIHAPAFIPYTEAQWRPFLSLYERCGIGFYDAIYDLLDNKNSVSGSLERRAARKTTRPCDQSWTPEGVTAKAEREESMSRAASAIQGFWKHRRLWSGRVDDVLLIRLSKVSTEESILTPVRERNYALALRRACAGLRLPVVKLLLQFRQERGMDIDINASSASNTNTALDWAYHAKTGSAATAATKRELIDLLEKAGGLRAEALASAPQASCS